MRSYRRTLSTISSEDVCKADFLAKSRKFFNMMMHTNSSLNIIINRVSNAGLLNSNIHNMNRSASFSSNNSINNNLSSYVFDNNNSWLSYAASSPFEQPSVFAGVSSGTMAMGILLLIFSLPAAAANLANALMLYKKRPLSARYVALLGSSSNASRRAPQELILLNLSFNNVLLSLACFVVIGSGTLQSSQHFGLSLTSVAATMMLEFLTCVLLTMRNALLMLVAYERAHSSRHSSKHVGILQEQLIFQRSLWFAWIVGVAFSLVECIVKFSAFGVHSVRQPRSSQSVNLNSLFWANSTGNNTKFEISAADFRNETISRSFNGIASNHTITFNHIIPQSTPDIHCFSYAPGILWWNWGTFSLQYVVPTGCCVILGIVAISNYFRALRAATRSVISSTAPSNSIALQPKGTAVRQRPVFRAPPPARVTRPIPSGVSASHDALKQKRARVYRASLKLGLFLLGSVIFSALLFVVLLFVTLRWQSTEKAKLQNSDWGVLDCRAIAIPNYVITPNPSDFSSLPWLLTFLMLCSTMIDPIAIGLSYSITPLATLVAQQQQRQHQNGQQQLHFVAPSLPQHQHSALGELLYKLYVWIVLYGGAWLQVKVFERIVRAARVVAEAACPVRMFKRQQQNRQARTVSLMAAGGGFGGGLGGANDMNLTELQLHQQQYQHMMQFMQPPQPYQNNLHHHQLHLRPNNTNNTTPFLHIAVQQQQKLRVTNQQQHHQHQKQQNRQILLTIENYINVSQIHHHHHHHQFSQTAANDVNSQHYQPELLQQPQQIKLTMPNGVSDIGDLTRPGSSAVPRNTTVYAHQTTRGGEENSTPSPATGGSPAVTRVMVEQMPHFVRTTSSTTTNSGRSGFGTSNAREYSPLVVHSANAQQQQIHPAQSHASSNQVNVFTTTTTTSADPTVGDNISNRKVKAGTNTAQSAAVPHPFQFGHQQPVWTTASVVKQPQFVRLGGEVQRASFGTSADIVAKKNNYSSLAEYTSAAPPNISRLPSINESF